LTTTSKYLIDAAAATAREVLLGRYRRLPTADPTVTDAVDRRIISALATADCREEWRDAAIRHDEPATAEDVLGGLTLYRRYRLEMENDERSLIDMARRRGISWAEIARRLGLPNGAAAQRRLRQLDDEGAGLFRLLDPKAEEADRVARAADRAARHARRGKAGL
jgi:hypothetical protein